MPISSDRICGRAGGWLERCGKADDAELWKGGGWILIGGDERDGD